IHGQLFARVVIMRIFVWFYTHTIPMLAPSGSLFFWSNWLKGSHAAHATIYVQNLSRHPGAFIIQQKLSHRCNIICLSESSQRMTFGSTCLFFLTVQQLLSQRRISQ